VSRRHRGRPRGKALDYNSLDSLANFLGKLFWADIERHHPGIASLRLPRDVADDWKRRLRTIPKTTTTPSGERVELAVERINYRECLTPVRAFYLDLAHWAVEDPGRWGPWVAPCPVGAEEINRKKAQRRLKARMDARTRERLPVLPVVVRSVGQRRKSAEALLEAARRAGPGEAFTAEGATLVRSVIGPRSGLGKVWVDDTTSGGRRDLWREEAHAFWAWAIVEVLRATGPRPGVATNGRRVDANPDFRIEHPDGADRVVVSPSTPSRSRRRWSACRPWSKSCCPVEIADVPPEVHGWTGFLDDYQPHQRLTVPGRRSERDAVGPARLRCLQRRPRPRHRRGLRPADP